MARSPTSSSSDETEGILKEPALTAQPHGAVSATKALFQAAPARTLDDQRLAEWTAQVARFRDLAAAFAPTAGE